MITITIIIGKFFYYYKILYQKLFKVVFFLIRKLIIRINDKDIEAILKSENMINVRSILFFYTGINIEIDSKTDKDYPVKRFKLKWYIWLIYYIWAVWLFFKIGFYMLIFYGFRFIKYDFWKILWLVLQEYWKMRFGILNWTLQIMWILIFIYTIIIRIGMITYQDHYLWLGILLRFFRLNKYLLLLKVKAHKFLKSGDKIFWWLNF